MNGITDICLSLLFSAVLSAHIFIFFIVPEFVMVIIFPSIKHVIYEIITKVFIYVNIEITAS